MANDGDVLFLIVRMWCIPVIVWRERLGPHVEGRGAKMRYQNQPVVHELQLCGWQSVVHFGDRAVAGALCAKGKIVDG
jgi:hypothetical protein